MMFVECRGLRDIYDIFSRWYSRFSLRSLLDEVAHYSGRYHNVWTIQVQSTTNLDEHDNKKWLHNSVKWKKQSKSSLMNTTINYQRITSSTNSFLRKHKLFKSTKPFSFELYYKFYISTWVWLKFCNLYFYNLILIQSLSPSHFYGQESSWLDTVAVLSNWTYPRAFLHVLQVALLSILNKLHILTCSNHRLNDPFDSGSANRAPITFYRNTTKN